MTIYLLWYQFSAIHSLQQYQVITSYILGRTKKRNKGKEEERQDGLE
jgi:hypothetical protein